MAAISPTLDEDLTSPQNRTIAIIEDSAEDAAAFARVFGAYGPVMHWTSGEQALAHLSSGEVAPGDLGMLVVDLYLPGIHGDEVVRQLRKLPGGAHAAIFVLSSSSDSADEHRVLTAGADEFIRKPHNVADLRALAARLYDLAE